LKRGFLDRGDSGKEKGSIVQKPAKRKPEIKKKRGKASYSTLTLAAKRGSGWGGRKG